MQASQHCMAKAAAQSSFALGRHLDLEAACGARHCGAGTEEDRFNGKRELNAFDRRSRH
jgi:hypothetical protein